MQQLTAQKLPALKKGEYYVTPIEGNLYKGYELTRNSSGIIIAGIYKGLRSTFWIFHTDKKLSDI